MDILKNKFISEAAFTNLEFQNKLLKSWYFPRCWAREIWQVHTEVAFPTAKHQLKVRRGPVLRCPAQALPV